MDRYSDIVNLFRERCGPDTVNWMFDLFAGEEGKLRTLIIVRPKSLFPLKYGGIFGPDVPAIVVVNSTAISAKRAEGEWPWRDPLWAIERWLTPEQRAHNSRERAALETAHAIVGAVEDWAPGQDPYPWWDDFVKKLMSDVLGMETS